jgi:hypothetical protein
MAWFILRTCKMSKKRTCEGTAEPVKRVCEAVAVVEEDKKEVTDVRETLRTLHEWLKTPDGRATAGRALSGLPPQWKPKCSDAQLGAYVKMRVSEIDDELVGVEMDGAKMKLTFKSATFMIDSTAPFYEFKGNKGSIPLVLQNARRYELDERDRVMGLFAPVLLVLQAKLKEMLAK